MKSKATALVAVLCLSLWLPGAPRAADTQHFGHSAAPAADPLHTGRGVVEAVDPAAGKLTMDHEPIESLRWPQMVMDFEAQTPGLFEDLKPGDKVKFDLLKTAKGYRISRIQPLP
jgi:Cu(I)/Ag(I) efflux system membrane fusion protein